MTRDESTATTRRGLLALGAGSLAALAGCSGVPELNGDESDPVTIPGSAVREVIGGEVPTVVEPLPVDVESAAVEERRSRVRDLLSSVPAPLTASDVANESIRTEIADAYGEAEEALDEAGDAEGDVEALDRLRDARESARNAAAAWAAVDGSLARSDVGAEVDPLAAEARRFRQRWRYVGDPADPIAALALHGVLEDRVESAVRGVEAFDDWRPVEQGDSPVAVGEVAERVEGIRASLADARYLYDRWTASIGDEAAFGSVFREADDSLTATFEERRAGLPTPGDGEVAVDAGNAPIREPLSEYRHHVQYEPGERERTTGQRASAVIELGDSLQRTRAQRRVRERVEDDEYVRVTTVDDVRALRGRAVEAIRSAVAADRHPRLTRALTAHLPGVISFADDRIRRTADDGEAVDVEWINRHLGRYVSAAAAARAAPAVAEEVAAALGAEGDG